MIPRPRKRWLYSILGTYFANPSPVPYFCAVLVRVLHSGHNFPVPGHNFPVLGALVAAWTQINVFSGVPRVIRHRHSWTPKFAPCPPKMALNSFWCARGDPGAKARLGPRDPGGRARPGLRAHQKMQPPTHHLEGKSPTILNFSARVLTNPKWPRRGLRMRTMVYVNSKWPRWLCRLLVIILGSS